MGIAAIEDMVAAQRDKIDWVVVELTGLADPAPIAKSFWANEEMGDLVLDAVVCVVDSRNILKVCCGCVWLRGEGGDERGQVARGCERRGLGEGLATRRLSVNAPFAGE